jgi:UDP-2,4-diacetamido-2,4,6-trideoxy-beta-L-altropyranose hydrolase
MKEMSSELYFRVDGNETIGIGHVMRCLAIASAASELGVTCSFITADAKMKPVIEQGGYRVFVLDSVWNRLDLELDVLCKLIQDFGISRLLVDSYFVTADYMHVLSKITRLAYMDDLLKEKYDCGVLINYNCYALSMGYHDVYARSGTQLLLGLSYVPLRPEFTNLPRYQCREQVRDILITTGGTDSINMAGMLSARLADELKRKARIHVVVGEFNTHFPLLSEMSQRNPCIVLHTNVKRMSELMRGCDVAISAGGVTLYELCACGIPTIVFMSAENQKYAYTEFTDGIMLAGGNTLVDIEGCVSNITRLIHSLLGEQAYRQELSSHMQGLVNGKGAYAIINKLFGF